MKLAAKMAFWQTDRPGARLAQRRQLWPAADPPTPEPFSAAMNFYRCHQRRREAEGRDRTAPGAVRSGPRAPSRSGRLSPEKGHALLIRAFARAVEGETESRRLFRIRHTSWYWLETRNQRGDVSEVEVLRIISRERGGADPLLDVLGERVRYYYGWDGVLERASDRVRWEPS